MATFPATLEPSPASQINPDRGLKVSVTEGGGVRGRVQYAEALYFLSLVYPDLDDSQVDLVVGQPASHFDAGPTDDHTVDVRGVTYDVNYQAQPAVTEYRGVLRTVRVNFIGTKQ